MLRFFLAASLCCSAVALAQATSPDDEWGNFPKDPNAPKPPPVLPTPPPPENRRPLPPVGDPPPPGPPLQREGISGPPRVPDEPNRTSMWGAPCLGQWKRGQTLFLGFPLLGVRLGIGLIDRLDFSLGFESFYGVMNEFSARAKVGIVQGANWSLSGFVEGTLALFGQRASKEVRGPRWITGRRNYGASPGLIVSYQGDSPRAARLFLELSYLLAFDTEPFSKDPLNGTPPNVIYGHNVLLHFGAEMPLSARTSFVFLLGMDFHGRSEDATVMPVALLGLVTGI